MKKIQIDHDSQNVENKQDNKVPEKKKEIHEEKPAENDPVKNDPTREEKPPFVISNL